jgi:hypothetical protein
MHTQLHIRLVLVRLHFQEVPISNRKFKDQENQKQRKQSKRKASPGPEFMFYGSKNKLYDF